MNFINTMPKLRYEDPDNYSIQWNSIYELLKEDIRKTLCNNKNYLYIAICKLEALYYYLTYDDKLYNHCLALLETKSIEYAIPEDRYYNFNIVSDIIGESVAFSIFTLAAKHFASIDMLIKSNIEPSENIPILREKFGDAINYLILLYNYKPRVQTN